MDVSILGAGCVGLVIGACFADTGNPVVCVDVDENRIARLNAGKAPIFESGLDTLIERNRAGQRLQCVVDAAFAVRHGHFQVIAVGAPAAEDGSADL